MFIRLGTPAGRITASLFAACAGLAVAALFSGTVLADGQPSAAVTPSQVTLTPGSSNTVVLVVTNPGPASVTSVVVTPNPTDPSIAVTNSTSGPPPTTIPAQSSVALDFGVTRAAEGTGQDQAVVFVITFAGSTGTPGTVVANLTVKAAPSPPVLDAKIQSNVSSIDQFRPGEAALVITNSREANVVVDSLEVTAPSYVDVTLRCPSSGRDLKTASDTTASFDSGRCALNVQAHSAQILRMSLTTTDTVAPGPRTVVVKVIASDLKANASSTAVATLGLTVDIFAESDVLKAVGVPIFLLFPGLVIVVVVQTFLTVIGPRDFGRPRAAAESSKELTGFGKLASLVVGKNPNADPSGSVGAVAISAALLLLAGLFFSLVVAKIYPWLTAYGPPFHSRNYLVAYGFRDFYLSFGYSVALGLLIWAVLAGADWAPRWWQDRQTSGQVRKSG